MSTTSSTDSSHPSPSAWQTARFTPPAALSVSRSGYAMLANVPGESPGCPPARNSAAPRQGVAAVEVVRVAHREGALDRAPGGEHGGGRPLTTAPGDAARARHRGRGSYRLRQPSKPSWLSSSNALKEFWMLFATTLSFGWPLLADAGSTRAVFAPFRNHPEMSARSVTFRLWPSCTVTGGTRTDSSLWLTSEVNVKALRVPAWLYVPVTRIEMFAKSGFAAMNAASSLELGLWISNSSALKVPAGTATATCCAMCALPSGSDTSTGPVSNSSQSPFPIIASQDATSARLSSTFRNTSWALRPITVP